MAVFAAVRCGSGGLGPFRAEEVEEVAELALEPGPPRWSRCARARNSRTRAGTRASAHTDEHNTLSGMCDQYSTAHLRAARPCAASPAVHGMASAAWSRGEGPFGEGVT